MIKARKVSEQRQKKEIDQLADCMDTVNLAVVQVLHSIGLNVRKRLAHLGPLEADFMALFKGVVATLEKRTNVKHEPMDILMLFHVTSMLFQQDDPKGRAVAGRHGIDQNTMSSKVNSLMRPMASARWYSTFRIMACESKADVLRIYH